MNGKGNRYNNAAFETYFQAVTLEPVWRHPWEMPQKAEMGTFEYINGFYTTRRRPQSGLNEHQARHPLSKGPLRGQFL